MSYGQVTAAAFRTKRRRMGFGSKRYPLGLPVGTERPRWMVRETPYGVSLTSRARFKVISANCVHCPQCGFHTSNSFIPGRGCDTALVQYSDRFTSQLAPRCTPHLFDGLHVLARHLK